MDIYKYYAPQCYNFKALAKKYFFFNKTENGNDPFDCSQAILEELKPYSPYFSSLSNLYAIKEFGICCFSKSKLNKHLWSLYANNYSGFCVEYDADTFKKFFDEDISNLPLIYATYIDDFKKITSEKQSYVKYDFSEDPTQDKEINIDVLELCRKNPSHREFDDLMYYLLSMKERSVWAVEEEVRLIFHSYAIMEKPRLSKNCNYRYEENGYKVPMPDSCIKSITIGHNMSEFHVKIIKRIAKSLGLTEIYQTSPESPFEISLKTITL